MQPEKEWTDKLYHKIENNMKMFFLSTKPDTMKTMKNWPEAMKLRKKTLSLV